MRAETDQPAAPDAEGQDVAERLDATPRPRRGGGPVDSTGSFGPRARAVAIGGIPTGRFAVRVMLRYAAFGLVSLLLAIIVTGRFGPDRGRTLAIEDAGRIAFLLAHSAVEPETVGLRELGSSDPSIRAAAASRLDEVAARVRTLGSITSVRVWTDTGILAYSDDPAIASGSRLSPEDLAAVAVPGGVTLIANQASGSTTGAVVRSLQPIRTNDTTYLVETLSRGDLVEQAASRHWSPFAGLTALALAAFWLIQIPLVWEALRRFRRRQDERESILLGVVDTDTAERRRLAHALRNGVLDDLDTVTSRVDVAGRLSDQAADPASASRLGEIGHTLGATTAALEVIADSIYPVRLQAIGLDTALAEQVDRIRHADMTVRFSGGLDRPVPEQIEVLVYRTAREAIDNIVEHSRAHHVDITLAVRDRTVQLSIADDGVGFNLRDLADLQDQRLGLRSLGDHAQLLDARLRVSSARLRGTVIELTAPLTLTG